jgi:hypothetical protein
MRSACREFLDTAERVQQHGPIRPFEGGAGSWDFFMALGQLRATFGTHLGLIAARYHLGIEGDLATILPPSMEQDDGSDLGRRRRLG